MALTKSPAVLVLLLMALAAQPQLAWSQDCAAGIGALTTCTPYVVPGITSGPPSNQCCTALNDLDHTCLCNTLDIVSRLPAACNLPPLSCAA